jgi:hypothetical protein
VPMKRLAEAHFVCPEGENLTERPDGTFETGRWVMDPDHAHPGLVVALHESKASPSYRQGVVEEIVRVDEEMLEGRLQRRVTLRVRATPRPLRWSGKGSGEKGYKWEPPVGEG